jgi:transposase
MKDYTGKKVYFGIDVHKRTYSVTAVCEDQIVKRDTLPADARRLINYCKKYFANAQIESAYEASFCGFHLHRALEAAGINNKVVHAAAIETAAGNKVKTDKRDSLKLATHLSQKRLQGINVPTLERENFRALTRMRESFVNHRRRFGCQLKSILHQHGMIAYDNKKVVSEKWLKELAAIPMSEEIRYTTNQYANMWLQLTQKIEEIEEKMALQSEKDEFLEMVYRSVPGVGAVSARVLANELGDTLQFSNERQLFNYLGLTPTEYSSGDNVCQGHITRQGKPILRKILVQVAWRAIAQDPSLRKIYDRIEQKAGGKKAIIGIARRLIGRIRSCFRTRRLYTINIDEEQQEKAPSVTS